MENFNVGFNNIMFVYASESAYNPEKLKVTIPEVFLENFATNSKIDSSEAIEKRVSKGNKNIFINEHPPALMNSVISKNYIELPVIKPFSCNFTTNVYDYWGKPNTINIKDAVVGIGQINAGDRLLAAFIGCNPSNGIIIARC